MDTENTLAIKDMLERTIILSNEKLKIISLVPSQTELLYDLGLEEEVLGITNYCIHPPIWRKNKVKVGGTKSILLEKIRDLRPNLIIANKEENTKEEIETLSKDYPVWISDIVTIQDAFEMITQVATLVGKKESGIKMVQQIQNDFKSLTNNRKKIAYFIWKQPWMVAAKGSYINEMLELMGFENVFQDKNRYPVIDLEELKERKPDLIFLSSEPYPFKEKHFIEFQDCLPTTKIQIVDGEIFSWYGSRMLKVKSYFEKELKDLN